MPGNYGGGKDPFAGGGGGGGGGGSRSSGRYGGGRDPFAGGGGRGRGGKRGKQKKSAHGVGGFFSNVYHQAGDIVHGAIPFVAHTGEAAWSDIGQFNRDPFHWHHSRLASEIVAPAVQSTVHPWAPWLSQLAHPGAAYEAAFGSPSYRAATAKTGERIYESPFSLLDLYAGASALARGAVAAGAFEAAPRSVVLRAPSGATITRQVVGGELTRTLKIGADQALKRLPADFAVLGEQARYGRAVFFRTERARLKNVLKARFYTRAVRALNTDELVALTLHQEFPNPAALDAYKAELRGIPGTEKQLALLNDETVMRHYTDPNAKILRARDEAARLGVQMADILGLGDTTFRRYLPMLHARGFRWDEGVPGTKGIQAALNREARLERLVARAEEQVGKQRYTSEQLKKIGELVDPDLDQQLQSRLDDLNREVNALRHKPQNSPEIKALKEERRIIGQLARFHQGLQQLGSEFSTAAREAGVPGGVEVSGLDELLARYEELTQRLEELGGRQRRVSLPEGLASELTALRRQLKALRGAGFSTRLGQKVVTGRGEILSPKGTARLDKLNAALSQARDELAALKQSYATRHGIDVNEIGREPAWRHPSGQTVDDAIAQIRAELEAQGLPEPVYRPHTSVEVKASAQGAGGVAVPKGVVYQNQGKLLLFGRLAHDIDSLTPGFMRAVKWASYVDKHNELLNAAVKVPRTEGLRKGYVWVKEKPSERMGYMERTAGEFDDRLEQLIRNPEAEGLDENLKLTADDTHGAEAFEDAQGFRYQVPERIANPIVGEFTKESKVFKWFWDKPTDVWRALVLNLRVGWLVNNIVGNTLLYLIKNAGVEGLRAYVGALAEVKGELAGKRLLTDPMVTKKIPASDMAELAPEQVAGAFMVSQMPRAGSFARTRAGRVATAIPRGLRAFDVAYEQALRRAMFNRLVRTNPEFKRFYNNMRKETTQFRQAAREIQPPVKPVPPGHTRLYRGEGTAYRSADLSDPIVRANAALNRGGGQGQWFSDSRAYAERFQPEGGSALRYVDVPEAALESFRFGKNEYILPEDLAATARDLTTAKRLVPPAKPVPPGHVRLYRGERPGEPESSIRSYKRYGLEPDETSGHWFTDDLAEAEDFALGGKVWYVDVPKEVARDWRQQTGWLLPGTIAVNARRVLRKASAEQAGPPATFRGAAKQWLEENPEAVDRISKQINDSLGDFLSLSRTERRALRSVAPFYAWYRAITLIMVKLPVDHPVRAAILAKLGEVGSEYDEDYGLPYLRGAVPVGGGYILKTRGFNPFTNPLDVAEAGVAGFKGLAGIPGGDPNAAFNFLGMLHPFLTGGLGGVQEQARGEYSTRGSGLYGIARGLPETQLIWPFPSKLYEGDDRTRTGLSYLGVPLVKPRPSVARERSNR